MYLLFWEDLTTRAISSHILVCERSGSMKAVAGEGGISCMYPRRDRYPVYSCSCNISLAFCSSFWLPLKETKEEKPLHVLYRHYLSGFSWVISVSPAHGGAWRAIVLLLLEIFFIPRLCWSVPLAWGGRISISRLRLSLHLF